MQQNNSNNEWFKTWFDSPFYHQLYKERNQIEAEFFIKNIFSYLNPSLNSKVLDVACGKGRHSVYINQMGYTTDGFDLSENSIKDAKQNENATLKFYVNDIRIPLNEETYDYALNLFTSFGYFDDDIDNTRAIKSIASSLKQNGVFVIDFFNSEKVKSNLNPSETKIINGIEFKINKEIEQGFVVKHIRFTQNSKEYHFTERVKLLSLDDFYRYHKLAKLKIEEFFGDYSLRPFNSVDSDRLIIISKKNGI
ncbi:MAG: methyltransferase domain-containing protein [Flavobacteriales bacterium]|nr:methyltransferase domain-containing protein [Flavobacteriales bacterium]